MAWAMVIFSMGFRSRKCHQPESEIIRALNFSGYRSDNRQRVLVVGLHFQGPDGKIYNLFDTTTMSSTFPDEKGWPVISPGK